MEKTAPIPIEEETKKNEKSVITEQGHYVVAVVAGHDGGAGKLVNFERRKVDDLSADQLRLDGKTAEWKEKEKEQRHH